MTRTAATSFQAELSRDGNPLIRFNFDNGWTASVALRSRCKDGVSFLFASVARFPTDECRDQFIDTLESEAVAEEVVKLLGETEALPPLKGAMS